MAEIQEYCGAAITVRGQYVLPGKQPPEGIRKLYIVVEADSERKVVALLLRLSVGTVSERLSSYMQIQMARSEIKRILKEEMAKAQNWGPGAAGRQQGRYSITFG